MTDHRRSRRAFIGTGAVSMLALTQRASAEANHGADTAFRYEVTRTDAEWRAMLTKEEHAILRKRSTELPRTSALWNNTAEGTYCCKGCALTIYDSIWKVELDKGWAFFAQSRVDTVLMDIDGQPPEGMVDLSNPFGAIIEAHCRRCGSHLGHILTVEGKTLHCINGGALLFEATAV